LEKSIRFVAHRFSTLPDPKNVSRLFVNETGCQNYVLFLREAQTLIP
jgi:hypothetical protein